ncbi:cytochrome b [Cellvibrio sp.]
MDRAGKIHKYVAWGLIALVALHAIAALFHHFIKRDKTLVRMLKPSDDSL